MPRPAITRINGGVQVAANTTNKNNGFYAPQLTTVQRDAIPARTLTNGAIIYNTTLGIYQFYQVINAVSTWANLSVSTSAATGVGLITGSPITIPTGVQAAVEVAGNQVDGFIYFSPAGGANANVFRVYGNGAWKTVTTVPG